MPLLDRVYWGNSIYDWIVALAAAAACFTLLALARGVIVSRLRKVAARTKTDLDDAVAEIFRSTKYFFLLALSVMFASNFTTLPGQTRSVLTVLITLAAILQGGVWGNTLIGFWFTRTMRERMAGDVTGTTSLAIVKFAGRVVLWTVLLLVTLDTLGVNVTAFITTLGIGGIAVALAVQNILGDLFASLSIVLDKPFVVGDFIVVDEYEGTVEHIGLKTTRLRSLGGEQIIISNSALLTSRIRNYRRMEERRVLFRIGVPFRTPPDTVERIPGMIGEIVGGIPGTRFERAHFLRYGEFSLVFEVVYHVLSPEYMEYARIQQAVNMGIMRKFRRERIEFAYPTQTLHLEK